jgi:acyl carrier protein
MSEVAATESIEQFVISTIAAVCDAEDAQICPDSALTDLAMDSLRITAFSAHLQATYGCDVTPDNIVAMLEAPCVSDLLMIVRKMTAQPLC